MEGKGQAYFFNVANTVVMRLRQSTLNSHDMLHARFAPVYPKLSQFNTNMPAWLQVGMRNLRQGKRKSLNTEGKGRANFPKVAKAVVMIT